MRRILPLAALLLLFALTSIAFAADPVISAANAETVHEVARTWRGAINDVAVSSDESLLAVGAETGAYLFDLSHRSAPAIVLPVDGTAASRVAFDASGSNLAVGTDGGKVYLFSTSTGAQRAILDESTSAIGIMLFTYSPFSLLVADGQTISVWSMSDFQKVTTLSGHSTTVSQLALVNHDNTIVSLDYKSLHFWDNASFFPRNTLDLNNAGGATAMAFDPTKPLSIALALGTNLDLDSDLSVTGGDLRLPLDAGINRMTFSPDGRLLASNDGNTITLRHPETGAPIATMFQGGYVGPMFFSPDGARLYAAGNAAIVVWDTATGKRLDTIYDQFGNIGSLSFSPDGRLLAAGNYLNPSLTVFDAATLEPVALLSPGDTGEINAVSFSPDGKLLAAAGSTDDNAITLYDTTTFKPVARLSGHSEEVRMLSFSPDGAMLASFASDVHFSGSETTAEPPGNTVRLWSIPDGALVREWLPGADITLWSGLFTPDGTTIITGSDDKIIRFWDPLTGKKTGEYAAPFVPYDMALNAQDSVLLYTSGNDTNYLNLTAHSTFTPPVGYTSVTSSGGVFAPDGNLAAVQINDGDIRLFDLGAGQPLTVLKGHTTTINTMVFSPDGTRLVSTGLDGTLRVWATGPAPESTAEVLASATSEVQFFGR